MEGVERMNSEVISHLLTGLVLVGFLVLTIFVIYTIFWVQEVNRTRRKVDAILHRLGLTSKGEIIEVLRERKGKRRESNGY